MEVFWGHPRVTLTVLGTLLGSRPSIMAAREGRTGFEGAICNGDGKIH